MRVLAKILGVSLIVQVFGVGYSGPPRLFLHDRRATLAATALAAPGTLQTGRLTWLGGVRLMGSDRASGGFSAMAVRRGPGGTRFTLLGDGGNLTTFSMGADWTPRAARFADVPDGPRTGWEKRDRDTESLSLDAQGRAWIGFESVSAIWRYAPGFTRAERAARPHAMRRWGSNGGPESLVRLTDGRTLVIAERAHWPRQPGRAGIVFAGDPTERPRDGFGFSYLPAPGFDPVDAAQLPGGDLLVLERRWLLPVRFRSRLVRVSLAALRPGAEVHGVEVGRIAPPFPTENYEGIAATREVGRTIVWLVSDDDQSWYRRSYLLKFRLD